MAEEKHPMFDGYPIELLNRSMNVMKEGDFYVSFLNLPNNLSNVLGRQVISVDPPSLSVQVVEKPSRQKTTYPSQGRFDVGDLTIEFRPDSFGIVMDVLFRQFLYQNGMIDIEDDKSAIGKTFDVQLEFLTPTNVQNQIITYRKCFLNDIAMPSLTTGGNQETSMSVTFSVENIDIDLKEWT